MTESATGVRVTSHSKCREDWLRTTFGTLLILTASGFVFFGFTRYRSVESPPVVPVPAKCTHPQNDKVTMFPGLVSNGQRFEREKFVPNIVHFTWYSGKKLKFRFHHYVSMLSAYKHLRPRKIMFWYELEPQGQYWEEIQERLNETLEMRHRKAPNSIFGRTIDVDEHKSDVVRLEAVLQFGGIYLDLDVIVVRPFDDLLRYDTTMGYELPNWLCNGIIISKPYAPFLKLWYMEYATFDDTKWNYHSVQLPGELALLYPSLIHTEYDTLNRPNWQELDKIYKIGGKYNWKKNYAVHLWYRRYDKDHNPEDIKTLDSTLGELMRYTYYGSEELIADGTDKNFDSPPERKL